MNAILTFLLLFGVMAVKRKRDPDSWTLEYDLWEFFSSYNQCDAGVQNREGDQCPSLPNPTVPPAPIPPPNVQLVDDDTILSIFLFSFSPILFSVVQLQNVARIFLRSKMFSPVNVPDQNFSGRKSFLL